MSLVTCHQFVLPNVRFYHQQVESKKNTDACNDGRREVPSGIDEGCQDSA